MEDRNSSGVGKRIAGVSCFVAAVVLLSLSVWLAVLGEFPAIKTADRSYLMFGAMSIYGVDVPAWAFYLIPGTLLVFAVGLWFVGWSISVRRHA